MAYTDQGYNQFLTKEEINENKQEQTDLDFDQNIGKFSGSKIDKNSLPGSAIMDGTLTNKDIAPSNRVVTAIVSQEANADFGDIQSALDYVNAQGGGKVLVLPGIYTITSLLIIYSDTQLEGLSRDDCIIDFNNTANNLSTNLSAKNIKISNLTFKNCWNSLTGTIYINKASRVLIDFCLFQNNRDSVNFLGYDIYANTPNFIKVIFCRTESPGIFYYADASSRINEISFNDISGPKSYSFQGGTTSNGGGQTQYIGNFISTPDKSVFKGKFTFAMIENNSIAGASTDLTETVFSFSSTTNIHIINNESTGGTQATVDFNNVDDSIIANNKFLVSNTASSKNCINITNGSDRNVITGNNLDTRSTGTSYAVQINAGCFSTAVVGNYLSGGTADTLDNGTSSTITANST